jgi:hypothetical protein
LPFTWYDSSFTAAVRMEDYRMRPDPPTGFPGRTHRFYTGAPTFEFGFGLSYAAFRHSLGFKHARLAEGGAAGVVGRAGVPPAQRPTAGNVTAGELAAAAVTVATVTVRNAGARAGTEVFMLFAHPPLSLVAAGAPRRQLLAFKRGRVLAPGEEQQVEFEVDLLRLRALLPAAAAAVAAAAQGKKGRWTFTTGAAAQAGVASAPLEVLL